MRITNRDRSRSFPRNPGCDLCIGTSCVSAFGNRRLRDYSTRIGISRDQLAFPTVPFGQDLRRWRASEYTGMDQPGESYMWDMTRGAEDALEIPD